MIKIAHVHQLETICELPAEVVKTIYDAVNILDNEYGQEREIDSGYGGYALVIEFQEELASLKEMHLDVEDSIPEYVDVIHCKDGQIFASSLILLGSEFGIVIIMPMAMMIHTAWNPYLNNTERSE